MKKFLTILVLGLATFAVSCSSITDSTNNNNNNNNNYSNTGSTELTVDGGKVTINYERSNASGTDGDPIVVNMSAAEGSSNDTKIEEYITSIKMDENNKVTDDSAKTLLAELVGVTSESYEVYITSDSEGISAISVINTTTTTTTLKGYVLDNTNQKTHFTLSVFTGGSIVDYDGEFVKNISKYEDETLYASDLSCLRFYTSTIASTGASISVVVIDEEMPHYVFQNATDSTTATYRSTTSTITVSYNSSDDSVTVGGKKYNLPTTTYDSAFITQAFTFSDTIGSSSKLSPTIGSTFITLGKRTDSESKETPSIYLMANNTMKYIYGFTYATSATEAVFSMQEDLYDDNCFFITKYVRVLYNSTAKSITVDGTTYTASN